jgi:hypothetical protein
MSGLSAVSDHGGKTPGTHDCLSPGGIHDRIPSTVSPRDGYRPEARRNDMPLHAHDTAGNRREGFVGIARTKAWGR